MTCSFCIYDAHTYYWVQLVCLCLYVFRANPLELKVHPRNKRKERNWFFSQKPLTSRSPSPGVGFVKFSPSMLASQLVCSWQALCSQTYCWEFMGATAVSCPEGPIHAAGESGSYPLLQWPPWALHGRAVLKISHWELDTLQYLLSAFYFVYYESLII